MHRSVAQPPIDIYFEVPFRIIFPHEEKQPCEMIDPSAGAADGDWTAVAVVVVAVTASAANAGDAAAAKAARSVVDLIVGDVSNLICDYIGVEFGVALRIERIS